MSGHPEIRSHHSHHTRFYIFMITLIVIGVFFVLYTNNDSSGTGIGSAIVGYAVGDTDNIKEPQQITFKNNKKDVEKKTSTKEIPLTLSLDRVPLVNEETSIEAINLIFNNPETPININNDKLELNGLEEVNFIIRNFNGQFGLEEGKLSLTGSAKEMEVNGLKFSSEEVIKISFEELDYNLLDISGISLKDLGLIKGNGEIKISGKLNYPLEDEEVELIDFYGSVKVDENSNSSLLGLDGVAGGVSVSGNLLDFNLW